MVDLFYRLTTQKPCDTGDLVQIGDLFFKVTQIEPLYYELRNFAAGVEVGFTTNIFPVPDMIPAMNIIHYVCSWGINGRVAVQIRYQAGAPRNSVGARSQQRLNRFQAPYLDPFTFKFAVIAGDTLEVDILAEIANVRAAIWFYGWKLYVEPVRNIAQGQSVVVLEDVRKKQ